MITRKLQELKIGFEAGLAEFRNDLPTLVMIHGAGGSSNVWKAQTHLLKRSVQYIRSGSSRSWKNGRKRRVPTSANTQHG